MTRSEVRRAPVVSWGELLWDILPNGEKLGGCASNVAVHVAQLGGEVSLVSCVGRDERGDRALRALTHFGVGTDGVLKDDELETGVVRITFEEGEPRFTIVARAAWDRIQVTDRVRVLLRSAKAFVYGTLAQRTVLGRAALGEAVSELPEMCLRICDLNLRSPHVERDTVTRAIELADIVKLNESELEWLGTALGESDPVGWTLGRGGPVAGSRRRAVVVTRGERGSVWHAADGSHETAAIRFTAAEGPDSVGAGDGYVAGLAWALANGASELAALEIATRVGGYVAARSGATPRLDASLVAECRCLLDAVPVEGDAD